MNNIRKAVLIGAGAVGVAYTSRITDADPKAICIYAEAERTNKYKKQGFIVNGKKYNFNYLIPEDVKETADLIIVAVKYHNLSEIIKSMKPLVGENTIIISLLNGISSEEILSEAFGEDKLLYSICVGIDAVRDYNSIKFSNVGIIHFGEKINYIHSKKVQIVKNFFDTVGISYVIPQNMLHTLWWKFMINVGINQLSSVLRAPYGVFQHGIEARELMEATMKEVIAVSKSVGVNLSLEDYDNWIKVLNSVSPEGKTSMLQDIEASRKTEVEIFGGAVCKLGEKYGVPTPMNDILVKMIKVIEDMNGVSL